MQLLLPCSILIVLPRLQGTGIQRKDQNAAAARFVVILTLRLLQELILLHSHRTHILTFVYAVCAAVVELGCGPGQWVWLVIIWHQSAWLETVIAQSSSLRPSWLGLMIVADLLIFSLIAQTALILGVMSLLHKVAGPTSSMLGCLMRLFHHLSSCLITNRSL